jgi:hypothetical protein
VVETRTHGLVLEIGSGFGDGPAVECWARVEIRVEIAETVGSWRAE